MRGHNIAGDEGSIYRPGLNGCGNLVYEPAPVITLTQRIALC